MEPLDSALRVLIGAMDDPVVILDSEDRIVAASESASKLLGHPPSALDGQLLGTALAGVPLATENLAITRTPVSMDSEGQPTRVLVRLEPAQPVHGADDLSDFARNLAHDLNNILGVVLMYNALLSRQVTDPSQAADLAAVGTAAEEAVQMMQSVLTFTAQAPHRPVAVDLNELVMEVADAISESLASGVTLELELAPAPVYVSADPGQITRALSNLAANAAAAMPAGGPVTIGTARTTAHDVAISIRDTGIGMSPELAARACTPFVTTRPGPPGAGLGLAEADGIVRQHQGTLTIDSVPDQGTTVIIVLPGARPA